MKWLIPTYIFGAVIDEKLQGELRITVIATGFTGEAQPLISPCAGGVQANQAHQHHLRSPTTC